jgi:diguanylate cyclase (GGDEF)-like protein
VLSLAAIVVLAFVGILKQSRLESALAQVNHELLDASVTDLLTGARNRRFFTNSIEVDVQQALRSFAGTQSGDLRNRDLVFYMIDIDHFKRVNDMFGHEVGDQVLAEVARRIRSAARLSDAVIRWGGEEFLLLSRYTDRNEAHILASRVLDSIGSEVYRVEGTKKVLRITCSVGWAAFPWKEREPKLVPHEQVLLLADAALYHAKASGRNRAVGLLPTGETVHGESAVAGVFGNGVLASAVATVGPEVEEISKPDATPVKIAVASGAN